MVNSLQIFTSMLWSFFNRVNVEKLDMYMKLSEADEWHYYAIQKRHLRPHVCIPCKWLKDSVDKNGKIFEPGCGSAINLIWLGLRGFQFLHGSDISDQALKLGNLISLPFNIRLDVKNDDCICPKNVPDKIDGLLSVNWLYHLEGSSLDDFFAIYKPYMASKCKVAFDMVDASYNEARGNEFHSSDLNLPLSLRRESEYKLRLSPQEIREIITRNGFRLIRYGKVYGEIPRTVWLVELEH